MNRQQKGEAYRAALTAAADSLARSRINSIAAEILDDPLPHAKAQLAAGRRGQGTVHEWRSLRSCFRSHRLLRRIRAELVIPLCAVLGSLVGTACKRMWSGGREPSHRAYCR